MKACTWREGEISEEITVEKESYISWTGATIRGAMAIRLGGMRNPHHPRVSFDEENPPDIFIKGKVPGEGKIRDVDCARVATLYRDAFALQSSHILLMRPQNQDDRRVLVRVCTRLSDAYCTRQGLKAPIDGDWFTLQGCPINVATGHGIYNKDRGRPWRDGLIILSPGDELGVRMMHVTEYPNSRGVPSLHEFVIRYTSDNGLESIPYQEYRELAEKDDTFMEVGRRSILHKVDRL